MFGNSSNFDKTGAKGRRIAFLLAPFVFYAAGVTLIAMFFYNSYIVESPYWSSIVASNVVEENDFDFIGESLVERNPEVKELDESDENAGSIPPAVIEPTPAEPPSETTEETGAPYNYLSVLPPLKENGYVSSYEVAGFSMGQMWAKLSVNDDLLVNDLPVYQGDNSAILGKGIGHLYGSTFPGEGGVCVLSGHVSGKLGYLNNLSDTDIYKPGTQLRLDTSYGTYVYELVDTQILNYKDERLVKRYGRNKDGSLLDNYKVLCDRYGADELLVMYTCHPEGTAFRTERYYIICRRIYGYPWR